MSGVRDRGRDACGGPPPLDPGVEDVGVFLLVPGVERLGPVLDVGLVTGAASSPLSSPTRSKRFLCSSSSSSTPNSFAP